MTVLQSPGNAPHGHIAMPPTAIFEAHLHLRSPVLLLPHIHTSLTDRHLCLPLLCWVHHLGYTQSRHCENILQSCSWELHSGGRALYTTKSWDLPASAKEGEHERKFWPAHKASKRKKDKHVKEGSRKEGSAGSATQCVNHNSRQGSSMKPGSQKGRAQGKIGGWRELQ